jgi:anti-anti-sigma factor
VGGRFGFRTRKVDEVELVEIVGDLDLHTLSLIDNLLQKLISRGVRNIVLDLAATDFLSSTAMGVILEKHIRMSGAGGKLMVAHLSQTAREAMAALALDKVIYMYDTVEEAIAAKV